MTVDNICCTDEAEAVLTSAILTSRDVNTNAWKNETSTIQPLLKCTIVNDLLRHGGVLLTPIIFYVHVLCHFTKGRFYLALVTLCVVFDIRLYKRW